MTVNEVAGESRLREQAIAQLKKRRDFGVHLLIWAMTDQHGFFWPIFPIVGWGIGVVLNAWDVFRRSGFSEEQISREIKHLQGVR
jgi:2TM domain-containing protein